MLIVVSLNLYRKFNRYVGITWFHLCPLLLYRILLFRLRSPEQMFVEGKQI